MADFVTISEKFQIVIPEKIRRNLNLRPTQKVQVFQFMCPIEVVPVRRSRKCEVMLKGLMWLSTGIKTDSELCQF